LHSGEGGPNGLPSHRISKCLTACKSDRQCRTKYAREPATARACAGENRASGQTPNGQRLLELVETEASGGIAARNRTRIYWRKASTLLRFGWPTHSVGIIDIGLDSI
jgi:hypothetical protein